MAWNLFNYLFGYLRLACACGKYPRTARVLDRVSSLSKIEPQRIFDKRKSGGPAETGEHTAGEHDRFAA